MKNKKNNYAVNMKNNNTSKSLKCLGLLIVAVNLGSVINFKGINLSWLVAILCIFEYITENHSQLVDLKYESAKKLIVFMMFWLFYATIQLLFVDNLAFVIQQYLILLINIFLVIFILLTIKTRYDFCYIMDIFSVSFFINIIAAYYEYFTGNHIAKIEERLLEGYQGTVSGFIGNFNDFCTFLFLAIIIFIIQLTLKKEKKKKIIYLMGIVSGAFFIFLNGSRGAEYGIYLLVIMFFVFFIELKIFKIKFYDSVVIFSSFIVIFVIVLNLLLKNGLENTIYIIDNIKTLGDYRSDIWRVNAIITCLKSLLDSYGFGIGVGQTIHILGGINVHNFYIEIICEFGLAIGLGAIYLSFIVFFKRNKNSNIYMNSFFRAIAVALIIVNVTSSSSNKMRAMWIFLTLIFIMQTTGIFFDEKRHKI